jgi:deoxyribonuclease IV
MPRTPPSRRPPRLRPAAAEIAGRAPRLGAHVSVAGGLAHGIARAEQLGCTAIQVFVKNQHRWQGPRLDAEDVRASRAARPLLRHSLAHAAYLINLGSPDDALQERSRTAMHDEMRRCAQLGLPYLVVHPGAHMGAGETLGLRRIEAGLRWLLAQRDTRAVSILLECTAGQGSSIGHRFEHLARLLEAGPRTRLGVCIDTCHLLAAGYDIRTARGHASVFAELEQTVGLERVRAFHLNDSKTGLGSRVDRHEEIGRGHLGRQAFGRIVRDERFHGLPMVIETPGSLQEDRRGLQILRGFLRPSRT